MKAIHTRMMLKKIDSKKFNLTPTLEELTKLEHMSSFDLDSVVTVQEAAIIKDISVRAIQQQCEKGKLICRKAYGTWLILRSSL